MPARKERGTRASCPPGVFGALAPPGPRVTSEPDCSFSPRHCLGFHWPDFGDFLQYECHSTPAGTTGSSHVSCCLRIPGWQRPRQPPVLWKGALGPGPAQHTAGTGQEARSPGSPPRHGARPLDTGPAPPAPRGRGARGRLRPGGPARTWGLPHWHLCQVLLSRRAENRASLLPRAGPRGCAQRSPRPAACRPPLATASLHGWPGGPGARARPGRGPCWKGFRAGEPPSPETPPAALARRQPATAHPLPTPRSPSAARPACGRPQAPRPPAPRAECSLPPLLPRPATHSCSSAPPGRPPGLDVARPRVRKAPGQPEPRSCRGSTRHVTLQTPATAPSPASPRAVLPSGPALCSRASVASQHRAPRDTRGLQLHPRAAEDKDPTPSVWSATTHSGVNN